jgi:hypothetical protein
VRAFACLLTQTPRLATAHVPWFIPPRCCTFSVTLPCLSAGGFILPLLLAGAWRLFILLLIYQVLPPYVVFVVR